MDVRATGRQKMEGYKKREIRPGADSEWGREGKNHCHKRY
jgi:hypothetical protein